jgi:hypothetical protein
MVYMEEVLWTLLKVGVLEASEDKSTDKRASRYIRDLVLADLKSKDLLSEDVIDSLLTSA